MTKEVELFIFGNLDGIYQAVKLTPLKKITADEVEFYPGDERMDINASLRAFMKDKDLLIEGKSLRTGRSNSRSLLWQGSSEKTSDSLFNALAAFSEKSKINFLVNYHSVEKEEINGEKKPVITFHPEFIMDGKRLINDFHDIELNRRYIVLGQWELQDITCIKPDSTPEPESFEAVIKNLFDKTLFRIREAKCI